MITSAEAAAAARSTARDVDDRVDASPARRPGVRWWTRFWEPSIPIERLAMVRILFGAFIVVDLVAHRDWIDHGRAPDLFHTPYGPLAWQHAPRLGTLGLTALWLVSLVGAVLVVVGWRRRLAFSVLVVAYGWWVLEAYSYGKPMHARTSLVTGLVALAFSPCTEALSVRVRRSTRVVSGWPIEVIAVSLAYLYLTAGIAKLRYVGLDWWQGGATQTGIALLGPSWAKDLVVGHSGLIDALALAALVFELAAPILLWRWRPRWLYAALAILFHVVVVVGMHVDFMAMAIACVALFPLERVLPDPGGGLDPVSA